MWCFALKGHTCVVGSFTELTLAMTFADGTPSEVISAFAQWRSDDAAESVASTAPNPPTLDGNPADDAFDADMHLGNFAMHAEDDDDPMEGLALPAQCAMWQYLMGWGGNAYFPGTTSTVLQRGRRWTLTTRTLPKEPGSWVRSIIAPLGRWAADGTPQRPWFAGYIFDENSPRPVLIWSAGEERFRFEGDFEPS